MGKTYSNFKKHIYINIYFDRFLLFIFPHIFTYHVLHIFNINLLVLSKIY